MGELTKLLQEFDIRFDSREDDEERNEFSFGDHDGHDDHEGSDDRVIDFRDGEGDGPEMNMDHDHDDHDDHEEDEDEFAGEKRVDITNKLRSMLGLDDEGEEREEEEERYTPSLSDLDLEDDNEEEFDFDVFNRKGER